MLGDWRAFVGPFSTSGGSCKHVTLIEPKLLDFGASLRMSYENDNVCRLKAEIYYLEMFAVLERGLCHFSTEQVLLPLSKDNDNRSTSDMNLTLGCFTKHK